MEANNYSNETRKLGDLSSKVTELQSPQNGVRKRKKVRAKDTGGIIGVIMKQKGMKSWHDNV